MKKFVCARLPVLLCLVASVAVAQPRAGKPPFWAFPIPDKDQPKVPERQGPIHVPGSTKAYTEAQIDDLMNPPDWFPDEHGAVPQIIQHGGGGVLACGSCHLMTGEGHPESATLAGLPVEYLMRQMEDFKSMGRKDPARMNAIAKNMSEDQMRQAVEWFASLKPTPWVKVVEADDVPRSYVSAKGRMRLPRPGDAMEPLGNRIIELPEDANLATARDPHSGFVAYVPKGSIAKGEALAKTGGGGKTIACTICHGDNLEGIGDVPRLAGLHPIYIVRQLYYFQTEPYAGTTAAALMRKVAANLDMDDLISLAAYASSLKP
jgi:cytochrome c553